LTLFGNCELTIRLLGLINESGKHRARLQLLHAKKLLHSIYVFFSRNIAHANHEERLRRNNYSV